jgi:hypothetical protein
MISAVLLALCCLSAARALFHDKQTETCFSYSLSSFRPLFTQDYFQFGCRMGASLIFKNQFLSIYSHTHFNMTTKEFEWKSNKFFIEFFGEMPDVPIAVFDSDILSRSCSQTDAPAFEGGPRPFGVDGQLRLFIQRDSFFGFNAAYIDYPAAGTSVYVRRLHHGFNFGLRVPERWTPGASGLCVTGPRDFDSTVFQPLIDANLPVARELCERVFEGVQFNDIALRQRLMQACAEDVAVWRHGLVAVDYRNGYLDQLFFLGNDYEQFFAGSLYAKYPQMFISLEQVRAYESRFSIDRSVTFFSLMQKQQQQQKQQQPIAQPQTFVQSESQPQLQQQQQQQLAFDFVPTSTNRPTFTLSSTTKPVWISRDEQEDNSQLKFLCNTQQQQRTSDGQLRPMFYLPHPAKREWFIQCDESGKVFLKFCPPGTVFSANLVCEFESRQDEQQREQISREPTMGIARDESLFSGTSSSKQTIFHPIVIDITPIPPIGVVAAPSQTGSTWSSSSSSIEQPTTTTLSREAPEFRPLCESKRTTSRVSFFLQHPTDRTLYIQCDEFGNAFLRSCPKGLWFSAEFTCKRFDASGSDEESTKFEGSSSPASSALPTRPQEPIVLEMKPPSTQMTGPTLTTYHSGASSNLLSLGNTEWSRDAPEFYATCAARRQPGVIMFYIPHPTDKQMYVQCDEFGKAFFRRCPNKLVFSDKLACVHSTQEEEKENGVRQEDLIRHEEDESMRIRENKPIIDAKPSESFGRNTFSFDQQPTTFELAESLEFKHLCSNEAKLNRGQATQTVFFVPHPTDRQTYIQCDEFGRAFIRRCLTGTFFSSKSNACVEEASEQPQKQKSSSFSTASSSNERIQFDESSTTKTQSPLTWSSFGVEAAEFADLCQSKRIFGEKSQFFMPHPSNNSMYIQCDEFGKAFVRMCSFGTVFTEKLVCEKQTDFERQQGFFNREEKQNTILITPPTTTLPTEGINVEIVRPFEASARTTTPQFQSGRLASFARQLDEQQFAFVPTTATASTQQQSFTTRVFETLGLNNIFGNGSESTTELANPCTEETKSRGQFFFAHPNDQTRYIQCDEFNKFTVRRCSENMKFDSRRFTCV